jgi:AraC-like DNA-binding protein/quercetin dioxygenase-like cupin family protein
MPHTVTRQPVVSQIPRWGVVIFESHHARGFRMGVSRHPWLEVFYVLEGAGVFELDGEPIPCHSGDVMVVPVGCHHKIKDDPDDPLGMYGLRIRPDVWQNALGVEQLLPTGRVRRNKPILLNIRAIFRQLLLEQTLDRPGCAAMMIGLATQVLALLARSQTRPHEHESAEQQRHSNLRQTVQAYIDELEHRFLEPASLDGIVGELGMSRRRFTELFRDITGTTWSRYVRRLRVNHARDLLHATSKTVLSVAFESGFEDLSSFYRAFYRETRLSPQRWRHRQRTG